MKNSTVTLNRRLTALTVVVITTTVLAACGGSGANALRNTTWELESLSGNGVLAGTTITLKFADDQVSGSAGCNQYQGSYKATEDGLSVSDVFSTEIGCLEPEGILEQETAYLTALRAAATYQIAADRLEIYDDAGTRILVFAAPTGDPTPIPQVSETPDTSGEPETVGKLAPINSVEITIAESFPPQYFVGVTSGLPNGCVEFDRYEVTRDGDTIRIAVINLEPVGMACTDEYGTVEHNIPLGSEFEPGRTDTVLFNDVTETFTAQGPTPAPSQVAPTPTPDEPTPASPTPTSEVLEATPTPPLEPPAGFKQYEDSVVGLSVFVPESWVVTQVEAGRLAYLQSYPEGKYIGGEPREAGDTKCDLTIRPPDIDMTSFLQQWKSDSIVTIVSEREVILQSGKPGTRLEVENMGRSLSLITEVNERVVTLTCFGESALFDEIAITLSANE